MVLSDHSCEATISKQDVVKENIKALCQTALCSDICSITYWIPGLG